MTMETHEFAEFFPLLGEAAFDELVADVKANGLREAITLYEGRVLDGRNRLRACEASGIEARFEYWQPSHEGDSPLAFICSRNLARRHLSDDARALIAEKIATYRRGGAGARHPERFITMGQAATLLNVSASRVGMARDVRLHGTPEDIAKVQSGEAKLGTVRAAVLARVGQAPTPTAATIAKQQQQAEAAIPAALPRLLKAIDAARRGLKLSAIGEQRGFYNTVQRVLKRATAEEIALLEAGERALYDLDERCAARHEPTLNPRRIRGLLDQIAACGDRLALLDMIEDRAAQLEGAAELVDRVSRERRHAVLQKVVAAMRLPLVQVRGLSWAPPGSDSPKPHEESVEDYTARGGSITKLPAAAVAPGTATIPAHDAQAIAAHGERLATKDEAVRSRRAAGAAEASQSYWRGRKVDAALLAGAGE